MKTNYEPPINNAPNPETVWLDKQNILQMLPISARTLQRWRSKGILPYHKIDGRILYKLSDIQRTLDNHRQSS